MERKGGRGRKVVKEVRLLREKKRRVQASRSRASTPGWETGGDKGFGAKFPWFATRGEIYFKLDILAVINIHISTIL